LTLTTTEKLNYPNPNIMNKLAKLLPILSIVLAIPTLVGVADAKPHHHNRQIADVRMGQTEQLSLTPEQKTKMAQLRQSTRTQIEQILTPEQRQKFQQIETQRQVRHQAGEKMNLTPDQKLKLKALRQANRQQFQAILTPAQQAQLKEDRNDDRGGRMARLDKLNLTSAQKAKMEQLKISGRDRMEAILTPAQRQTALAMHDRRSDLGGAWKSMNLTAEQKAKIKTIHQASKQQFNAILTPEQQSKLKSDKHGRRHHAM
jgi:Spy/CpxP family protein refolding chaperone